jgi:hypothetical protein
MDGEKLLALRLLRLPSYPSISRLASSLEIASLHVKSLHWCSSTARSWKKVLGVRHQPFVLGSSMIQYMPRLEAYYVFDSRRIHKIESNHFAISTETRRHIDQCTLHRHQTVLLRYHRYISKHSECRCRCFSATRGLETLRIREE